MKVLVATAMSQGLAAGDYFCAVDGELVIVPVFECDSPRCGCDRGFGGLASHRASTTAQVVDRDIAPEDFRDAVTDSLARQGWLAELDDDEATELVDEAICRIHMICDRFRVGAIVRRKATFVTDSVFAT